MFGIFLIFMFLCAKANTNLDWNNIKVFQKKSKITQVKSRDNVKFSSSNKHLIKYNDSILFQTFTSYINELKLGSSLNSGACCDMADSMFLFNQSFDKDLTNRTIGLTKNFNNDLNVYRDFFLNIKLKRSLIPFYSINRKSEQEIMYSERFDYLPFDTVNHELFLITVSNKITFFKGQIIVLAISILSDVPSKDHGGLLISFHSNGIPIDCIEWNQSSCSDDNMSKIDINKNFILQNIVCENVQVNDFSGFSKEYRNIHKVCLKSDGKFMIKLKSREIKAVNF